MDFSQFSGVNALITVVASVVVGILTIAHNRRITREEMETSRKEWADVATRRLEIINSLQTQVDGLKANLLGLTGELGELRQENRFLRDRNVELQKELDERHAENRQLRRDLRHAGIDIPRREQAEL